MARVEGMREAADWLGDIAGRLRDPAPALRVEAELVKREATAAIAARRAPDGSSWPAVKTSSARPGRKATPRTPTRSSGRLGRSGVVRVDGAKVVLEFTAPYAGFVNEGTEDMAARRFVPQGNEGPLAGLVGRVGDFVVKGPAR